MFWKKQAGNTSRSQSPSATNRKPHVPPSLGLPEQCESRILLAGPTAQEQELLYDINHFRVNPSGELSYLFTTTYLPFLSPDLSVNLAMTLNLLDQLTLQQQFQALTPASPLTWNNDLADAAADHNDRMRTNGYQSHQYPLEPSLDSRVASEGYSGASRLTENLYGYAHTPFHAHSAMVVDWGVSANTHRNNLLDQNVREVGISWLSDSNILTGTGPYVLTQNFGNRSGYGNPYLVGSIYNDLDGNGRYEAGEGLSGVTVTVTGNGNTYSTSTLTAGGYQIQVPAGTYKVTVSGGGYYGKSELEVTVGSDNREVDFISGYAGGFVDFALVSPPVDQVGIVRLGIYYLDGNGNRVWDSPSMSDSLFDFGNLLDRTVVGDWNGDGFDEIGVFRLGTWFLDKNGNGIWDGVSGGDFISDFGIIGDTPIVGDWDGDGIDNIGVVRLGQWNLDLNGNGAWDGDYDTTIGFGALLDTPLIGDWDGNGIDDFGVKRGDTWYLDWNGNRQWDDTGVGADKIYSYGNPLDLPVIGDWYGDGSDKIGIVRLGMWYLDQNGNGVWDNQLSGDALIDYGIEIDVPIVGKWPSTKIDGDGTYLGILSNGTGVGTPPLSAEAEPSPSEIDLLDQLHARGDILIPDPQPTSLTPPLLTPNQLASLGKRLTTSPSQKGNNTPTTSSKRTARNQRPEKNSSPREIRLERSPDKPSFNSSRKSA